MTNPVTTEKRSKNRDKPDDEPTGFIHPSDRPPKECPECGNTLKGCGGDADE